MTHKKAINKPMLKYYGSKWQLAPWVISHFPPHSGFFDACFGSGAISLIKPPCKLETICEIDGEVTNFVEMVRTRLDELVQVLQLTPYSQTEYNKAFEMATDPLERARRVFIRSWMSVNGYSSQKSSFRVMVQPNGRGTTPAQEFSLAQNLWAAARRMSQFQILNDDAFKYLRKFAKASSTLVYLDPPYLKITRINKTVYRHEWTLQQHIDAASILQSTPNTLAVVSGYYSDLYNDIYHGWQRIDKTARTSGSDKTESLWLSPAATIANKSKGLFTI